MRKEPFITQRKNKSGCTFLVRVRDDETEITKSFNEKDYPSTKIALDAAIQFRDRILYEIRMGLYLKDSAATVQDMFEASQEMTTDSYSTKKKSNYLFGKYVLHKDTPIQKLTSADIQTDLNKMVNEATDDTIAKVLSIWRSIIKVALQKEILVRDVTIAVTKPSSKVIHVKKSTETDKATLNKVENLILTHVQDQYNAKIINYLLEVLYYTGMRPAEALALTRSDITPRGISITKEIGSDSEENCVVRRCKSPNSVRVVPIHPDLVPILEDLMRFAETDYLFKNSYKKYMDSTWIGNIIRRLCKMEKIEFNMYRLRHNLATLLVTNNVDSKTTVELLGHANYDMSIYYANSNDELKEEAIKYLS